MANWRTCVIGGLTAVLALLPATTAHAAAPPNDTPQGAVAITALPFTAQLDTSEATTDATDAQLNQTCGAPATDASVWFMYTPIAAGVVSVDTTGSGYSSGVLVGVGSPETSLTTVACAPDAVSFVGSPGTTYWLLVIDDQFDGDGRTGGPLSLRVQEQLISLVDVSLTVDPVGTVDRFGVATLTGTLSCVGGDGVGVSSTLTQRVGSGRVPPVRGFGFTGSPCEGTTPWSMQFVPDGGRFAGGKAASASFAWSCNFFMCDDYVHEAVVQLWRGGR